MIKQDETGQATAGTGSRAKVMIVMLVALAVAVGVAYAGVAMPQARTLPWTFVYPILAGVGTGGLLAWLLGQMRFSTGTGPGPAASISLQDATGEAEVLADDKGRVISSNGAYVALLSKAGLSRTVGMDVLYAGYPDFAEPVYQLAQAARAGKTLHRDLRVAAHSSVPGASATEARWLRLSVFPAGPAAQPSQSTLWRLTDITADRNTQESAFARLQFIITYLDHAPVGFFSTLPDGKVDYVNATLADWLGLDLAEAHGGKIVLPSLVGTDLATQLSSVQPSKNGSHTEQFSGFLPRRNGQPLAVDIVHRTDFDGEGRALPFRSMVLRKADGLVGETLAPGWFETLAPAAPIGLARITQDGAVGKANTKFLELSPAVRLLGPLEAAVKDVDKPQLQATLAALRDGKVTNATCDLLFEGTPPRSVALTLVRPSATTGELLAYGVDRTENKALEVQLAQSQKMQAVGQLASGIAHDFNNVLTPIIGFADLLLAKMRPTDAAFADIMNIKQNANRAANLVRQLLAFSRKQTMQPKVHLLSEAMSDLGNLLSRVLGEKVGLDISHARDLGHVMVDINQFEQVIINLAVNGWCALTISARTR
jgi:two-component system, cell cycle sensor histidine kinase and response regulator CckA